MVYNWVYHTMGFTSILIHFMAIWIGKTLGSKQIFCRRTLFSEKLKCVGLHLQK